MTSVLGTIRSRARRVSILGQIFAYDPGDTTPPILPVYKNGESIPPGFIPLDPSSLFIRGITPEPTALYYLDMNGVMYRFLTQSLGSDLLGNLIPAGSWEVVNATDKSNTRYLSNQLVATPQNYGAPYTIQPSTFMDAQGNIQNGARYVLNPPAPQSKASGKIGLEPAPPPTGNIQVTTTVAPGTLNSVEALQGTIKTTSALTVEDVPVLLAGQTARSAQGPIVIIGEGAALPAGPIVSPINALIVPQLIQGLLLTNSITGEPIIPDGPPPIQQLRNEQLQSTTINNVPIDGLPQGQLEPLVNSPLGRLAQQVREQAPIPPSPTSLQLTDRLVQSAIPSQSIDINLNGYTLALLNPNSPQALLTQFENKILLLLNDPSTTASTLSIDQTLVQLQALKTPTDTQLALITKLLNLVKTTPQEQSTSNPPVPVTPIQPDTPDIETDDDQGREIEDDIHINAQVPAKPFLVSEKATSTPLPLKANANGKPGLAFGNNPTFGTSIAAQALKKCLKVIMSTIPIGGGTPQQFPIAIIQVSAPTQGGQTKVFKGGPIDATKGLIGTSSGNFASVISDADVSTLPVTLPWGTVDLTALNYPGRMCTSPLFPATVFGLPPGFDPILQWGKESGILDALAFAGMGFDGVAKVFRGPPGGNWTITVAPLQGIETSPQGAPIVGTVMASGTFDQNGISPVPPITVLQSVNRPLGICATGINNIPVNQEAGGPYSFTSAINYTVAVGTPPSGYVYVFRALDPKDVTIARNNGYTWRSVNNSPWSVPENQVQNYIARNPQQEDPIKNGLLKVAPIFRSKSPSSNGSTVFVMGKSGRSGPAGGDPNISAPHPEYIAAGGQRKSTTPGLPTPVPFGGYQMGVNYFPRSNSTTDPDPTINATHFVQALGSDTPLYISYFLAQTAKAARLRGGFTTDTRAIDPQTMSVQSDGYTWSLDGALTNNPFYDGLGAAGPGSFVDVPTMATDVHSAGSLPQGTILAPGQVEVIGAIPPVRFFFALALGWVIITPPLGDPSIFNSYIDLSGPISGKSFSFENYPGGAPTVALSAKGLTYQYRASFGKESTLITEDLTTNIINFWDEGTSANPNSDD